MEHNLANKKIGVITHYYNSVNYGGNLQAYALVKVLQNNGFDAEQICYLFNSTNKTSIKEKLKEAKGNKFVFLVKKTIKKIVFLAKQPFRLMFSKTVKEQRKNKVAERRAKAFEHFNKNIIPHGKKVYDKYNINECDEYDIFITGSDQVWNMIWYHPANFLEFVPPQKKKIAYSASVSLDSLTAEQQSLVKEHLKDFDAISVREESAVDLINPLSPVDVKCTLDPTLLLNVSEWEEVREDYPIDAKYVFCYFLGSSLKSRQLATQFAKENNLKLVTIAHAGGICKNDTGFGDERLYGVSPEQFLSLIKNAEYIFTDSFHAVVFSNLYKKQYFIFNRNATCEMSSRIYNITKLFNTTKRYCDCTDKENLQYIKELENIDYSKENKEVEQLKKLSLEFLLNSVN